MMDPKLVERFWSHVERSEGCWTWKRTSGYGILSVGPRGAAVRHYAHRLSWELHNGPIPDGMFVLHRCDNPPCVRPDHLFLGTQTDNMQDCAAKGRSPEFPRDAEHNGNAKLTWDSVGDIRALAQMGASLHSLSRQFQIGRAHIKLIVTGQRWRRVA